MEAKVKLLENFEEIEKYDDAIKEHGEAEAFNLGLYDKKPKEIYIERDFLFRIKDVLYAWTTGEEGDKSINLRMNDDDTWSVAYSKELWDKLKTVIK